MTSDEEHALDAARGQRAAPVLRDVIASGSAGSNRRRLELHDLFSVVLPDGDVPGDELWMGEGAPRPMVHHDHELLLALQEEGFEGLVWSELADRLARYGLGVIGAWIVSGEIYERTTQKGRPVKPPLPPFIPDERTALAIDTVADGIKLFKQKGLGDGDWDPSRGARLSTYFIGSCVLCFANLCRKQLVARSRTDQDVFFSEFGWESAAPSAERVALGRIGLGAILTSKNKGKSEYPEDVVNLVVTYSLLGYKSSEISELISGESSTYTASVVRKILSAYRKRVAKEQREGGQHV